MDMWIGFGDVTKNKVMGGRRGEGHRREGEANGAEWGGGEGSPGIETESSPGGRIQRQRSLEGKSHRKGGHREPASQASCPSGTSSSSSSRAVHGKRPDAAQRMAERGLEGVGGEENWSSGTTEKGMLQ